MYSNNSPPVFYAEKIWIGAGQSTSKKIFGSVQAVLSMWDRLSQEMHLPDLAGFLLPSGTRRVHLWSRTLYWYRTEDSVLRASIQVPGTVLIVNVGFGDWGLGLGGRWPLVSDVR